MSGNLDKNLDKKFILKIFEGFSIQRWNDLVRPFDLVEMDKAAEKMVAAYIIGKYEESEGHVIDWEWMIYASLFDLLKKIALCDIKSPVQQMIRAKYPEEYKKLNDWVFSRYENIISDKELLELFSSFLGNHWVNSVVLQLWQTSVPWGGVGVGYEMTELHPQNF